MRCTFLYINTSQFFLEKHLLEFVQSYTRCGFKVGAEK